MKNIVTTTLILMLAGATLVGCRPDAPPEDEVIEEVAERPDDLRLLVVGDPDVGDKIARQWSARRDGELAVVSITAEEFVSSNYEIGADIDVVIYPTRFLGDLASNEDLLPVPKWLSKSDTLNREEFLRHHRLTLVRHGSIAWAIPLGAPQMAVVYNVDALKKRSINPPETWKEFVAIGEQLRENDVSSDDESDPPGQTLPVTVELPLAKGWAANTVLARVAPLIRNRGRLSTVFERNSMEPLIASAPFVKALTDIKLMIGESHASLELTPADVYQRLLAGKSAIGVTWPSRSFSDELGDDQIVASIGVVEMPGSSEWYDSQSGQWTKRPGPDESRVDLVGFSGLLASVSQEGRNTEWAFRFLEWLGSKPINLVTIVDSPLSGPMRASHLGDPTRWTGTRIPDSASEQYVDVIRDCNERPVVFMFPRLPGQEQYTAALDQNIRACLKGDLEPKAALEKTAEQWEAITEERGRQNQIRALRSDAGY